MGNIGCKVVTDFVRPDPKLVEAFRGMPVANIDDNMGRTAAVHQSIRPLNKVPLVGVAFTIKVPQGDNLMFHKAMDLAKPGDIIVIDAGGFDDRSIFGELMATYCKVRGVAGLVVDGAIRDQEALCEMDMPIYAKSTTPNGPYKNGPGEINVPVVIGGRVVRPGDILVGDQDGLIVIPPEQAQEVLEKTRATMEKEAKIMEDILTKGTYIRPWVDEKLNEIGCDMI